MRNRIASVYRVRVMRYPTFGSWLPPAVIAVLVMLPRLGSPHFGLLDDGVTLQTGRETIGRWASVVQLIPETGRFFPAYWLVYSALFAVVGVRPLAFFGVNVLLLVALLVLLVRLVRLGGGSRRQAAVAAVLFAGCGPTIEAFYTLSKAEPLQLTWIALAILCAASSAAARVPWRRGALLAFTVAALVLAYTTKETSVVLVPISLGWVAIEWCSRARSRTGAWFAGSFAAANLVAAAIFLGLRWRYATRALGQGWYTRAYTVQLDTLGPAVFRIAAWLAHDFAFVLPLLVAGIVMLRRRGAERRLLLYAAVWMAGWLAIYAPWPATFEYYLLPFAFGAAALAGSVVDMLWRRRAAPEPIATRRLAWSALAVSALLWLPGVVNAAADARVQLAVDDANADLVDFLAGLPSGSRLILNTTGVNEYFYEVPLHLAEIKGRGDLVVQHAGHAAHADGRAASAFVITPILANAPALTVRIAVYEGEARPNAARLTELLRDGGELVHATERQAPIVELAIHRVLCPLAVRPFVDATYCPSDRGLVDARTFTYGWRVHRLRPRVDRGDGRA